MFKDPFIISSIILAITFLFILICNKKLQSKLIKYSFVVLAFIFLILILIFDSSYAYEFLKAIVSYVWYPNYLLFVSTIIIVIGILLYTLFNEKMAFYKKIINYCLFTLTFSCYVIFQRLGIDVTKYTSLYSTKSLVVMRIVTITFTIWVLFKVITIIINRRKKNEK